jgi:hypothetical protein
MLQDNDDGIVLRNRLLPKLQQMMANCRSANFAIRLADGSVLNFWDTARCDEELIKVNYK